MKNSPEAISKNKPLSTWSNKSSQRGYLLQKPKKSKLYWFYLTSIPSTFQNTSFVFTGFSDIHKLVLTAFKTKFVKSKPKELSYRDYKPFNHECLEKDLKYAWSTFEKINYQEFEKFLVMKLFCWKRIKSEELTMKLQKASLLFQ